MTDQIQFAKPPGEWVMRITADRRIEVNEGIDVTDAAKHVLEALQTLLEQPERKPLTDDEVCGVLGNLRESITSNVFLAFARAIEAAHGIGGEV